MPLPGKLISGAQTGADMGGLRAGKILGIPTGGWIPRGCLTERGPMPWLLTMYGLREHASPRYGPRTTANAVMADLTILFGDFKSSGSARTLKDIGDRPKLVNPSVEHLRHLAESFTAETVINIAGNRESGNPKIELYVTAILVDAWADLVLKHPVFVPQADAAYLRRCAPYPPNGPRLPIWSPR